VIFATFRLITILFFRFLGRITFYLSKKRKPVALANVNLCFPVKSKHDKKRNNKIVRDSFIYLAHMAADFFLLRFYTSKNIDKYIEIENLEYFKQAQKEGKGVILAAAHFGSWELAAHFLALKWFKCLVLYNPIKKPLWLETFVKNNRGFSGNTLISKKSALLNVYRHLKKGGSVAFMMDQHCFENEGIKASFFGHQVWTHKSFIELSLKTGVPIVFGFMFIKGLNKYSLKILKPLYPQDFLKFDHPEYEMASLSNKHLENAIRQAPGNWMWQHRRFKGYYL